MPFASVRLLLVCSILACVTGALVVARVSQADDELHLNYRALVEAYRAGETARALAAIRELESGDLVEAVQRLATLADAEHRTTVNPSILDPAFFRAAAVMHADAAVETWKESDAERALLHRNCGALLVDALTDYHTDAEPFRRRWYLMTALITARYASPGTTIDYFERVLERLPGDVSLLTAAGWYAERLSFARIDTVVQGRGVTVTRTLPDMHARQRSGRRRYQQLAIEWLEAALEVSPGAPGATLRLARIEFSRGHDAQARELLVPLVARDDVPLLVAYVGRLVLGGVHERSGQSAEAERLYREAMALVPPAQSARLALARLMYAADPAAAAETVAGFLSSATEAAGSDPWADYQLAYLPLGMILLDELRLEVRR